MPQECKCGSEEWIEERVIVLSGSPSELPELKSTPRSVRYRLKCAECGLEYGAKPTKKGKAK
jgi:hypothetical protein